VHGPKAKEFGKRSGVKRWGDNQERLVKVRRPNRNLGKLQIERLEGEEDKEGSSEGEEGDCFCEGESEDSKAEELVLFVRVAGNTCDEGREDETDTNTDTCERDGGKTGSNELSSSSHR
jgi:hypothetical protein